LLTLSADGVMSERTCDSLHIFPWQIEKMRKVGKLARNILEDFVIVPALLT